MSPIRWETTSYIRSGQNSLVNQNGTIVTNVLMVKEAVVDSSGNINEPTSWYWNIRVGDKIQLNDSGLWYTVVGPMTVTQQQGNSELFVNVGPPGSPSPLTDLVSGVQLNPEFLLLTNGLDDNKNGWTDEGFDGVDNNFSAELPNGRLPDRRSPEWEAEAWPTGVLAASPTNQVYTIQRRPAPAANSREIALPTNVVIDMTTWGNAFQERSQFPAGVINPYTGYVDILLYPNGTVVPTTTLFDTFIIQHVGRVLQLVARGAERRHGSGTVRDSATVLADRQHQAAARPTGQSIPLPAFVDRANIAS